MKTGKLLQLALITAVFAAVFGGLSLFPAQAAPPDRPAPERGNPAAPPPAGQDDSLPPGATAEWWATVRENIRQSEYRITRQAETDLPDVTAAYQAPNRAHNLRTYFTGRGPVVVPRDETAPSWRWGLTLTGYGYQEAVQPIAPPAGIAVHGNRVEYNYQLSIDNYQLAEWYINDERGLEQGFTLSAPPTPHSLSPTPLVLQLAVRGNLTPLLNDNNQTIEFSIQNPKPVLSEVEVSTIENRVTVLRYSDLRVYDATGRKLPAWFELGGRDSHILRILINDANAIYPLTVDPLATSPNWTATGEGTNNKFSASVGTAGDVNGDGYADVIVGAYGYNGNTGRVYVYQ
ncbi:MAG: integrin alpha, partial [Anaerolineales bacterium]